MSFMVQYSSSTLTENVATPSAASAASWWLLSATERKDTRHPAPRKWSQSALVLTPAAEEDASGHTGAMKRTESRAAAWLLLQT